MCVQDRAIPGTQALHLRSDSPQPQQSDVRIVCVQDRAIPGTQALWVQLCLHLQSHSPQPQ